MTTMQKMANQRPITKAVIPAAGYGTRFLPISKGIPKEMIPVVDTPVIQLVVEEAVQAGLTDIIIVISRDKRAIEEHFDRNVALEATLEAKGRSEDAAALRRIATMANIHYVWQQEMNGLGDAIRCARYHVGNEPFAVLLGDTIMASTSGVPVVGQLLEVHRRFGGSVVALEKVPPEKVHRYGVIDGVTVEAPTSPGVGSPQSGVEWQHGGVLVKARGFVEKPSPAEAPSDLAVASRYLFTPAIFEYLDRTPRGKGNEIQITDAMRLMVNDLPMYGLQVDGIRYDIGNKLDFIKTNLLFGLEHPEIGPQLREWLKSL
jgi:UTP--glucose-1-phosphate uridylyltransferase